ncbi:glycoside hydrolase [Moorella thermoacetica]|uniref:Sporulation-specific glycosylase YdhD n=3 Tax=Neomoorella thermoacetica TaxID=1525 RepID=A0A1D7X6S4_NEOTH|nr:glycosyl hydrolase family 18 protein [Moorella thermoacetica]AKX92892.1 putative sporulation-specific glycosylase YdhD [Moorella thermoacetica]AKX95445.1 putative sporulation-specific glycosylase YdhD [Moorella thermoacetica]AOQ22562.1 Putative sporulation-specific glycosylase YdhD [Moorella thermoacetica]APC07257.1 putative sporulation-specific glycosylase YdhD [Moorella thermoacetica]OIQ10248.1 putative sporulation-specific glycosylase YdhD [Moorella thermoacetica]
MALQERQLENNWYYVPDPSGLASLRSYGGLLRYVLPFWFGVTENGGLVDQADTGGLAAIRRYNLPVLAIVHNYSSPQYGPLIHRLLTTEGLRQALVQNILNLMYRWDFAGVNIDFEFVPPEDRPYLTSFLNQLGQTLKGAGFLTTISVPAELRDNPRHPFSGAFSYPNLAAASDQVYILAYDEHFATPGPIASTSFIRQVLDYAVTVIPREKIRLGMAVYGYDWAEGARVPVTLSHSQVLDLARRVGASIYYDPNAQESTFTYVEDNTPHVVWFEDVRSFSVRLGLVREYNLPGIAVWRLGLEDQRIWELRG